MFDSFYCSYHDDVIKWKHFPRYWHFVRGIHRSPVKSPHKGQWRGALMFRLICALNKRLSKQSWGWWFEMQSRSLWRCTKGSKKKKKFMFLYLTGSCAILKIFHPVKFTTNIQWNPQLNPFSIENVHPSVLKSGDDLVIGHPSNRNLKITNEAVLLFY